MIGAIVATFLGSPLAAAPQPSAALPEISINELAADRFELIHSGSKFSSRDAIEGRLLLSSARLALAHGQGWFVLLTMPGERIDVHPSRRDAAFGTRYGHWQPHWTYYLAGYGWQPWHPEWGAEFWAGDVDVRRVEQFEAHAMIELGKSANPLDDVVLFDANAVIRDGDLKRVASEE